MSTYTVTHCPDCGIEQQWQAVPYPDWIGMPDPITEHCVCCVHPGPNQDAHAHDRGWTLSQLFKAWEYRMSCPHEKQYHYYGGTFGYYHCPTCNKWWQADLNGWRNPDQHMKEVDQPYTRDLLSDFVGAP